mmetsp:Transcript_1359/g.3104  ORF Transcript_1359/g.3104 Transcript_1359/m.3104 type:complete len:267 (+) Transcript_1359:177-977(+)
MRNGSFGAVSSRVGLLWISAFFCYGFVFQSVDAGLPAHSTGAALHQQQSVHGSGLLRLRGGKAGGLKARDLWDKDYQELDQLEEELRTELMSLRVAQQVGGQPGRVNRIKMVRKSIARVLTVLTSKKRSEEFEKVVKDKFKPYDARPNRHWTKAMRLRLNRYERTRKSQKALRCIRSKVWGAGERPMKKFLGLSEEMEEVGIGKRWEAHEERTFEKYPPHKYGAVGKQTSTGHIPKHAEMAIAKRKERWERESKRVKALKAARAAA